MVVPGNFAAAKDARQYGIQTLNKIICYFEPKNNNDLHNNLYFTLGLINL